MLSSSVPHPLLSCFLLSPTAFHFPFPPCLGWANLPGIIFSSHRAALTCCLHGFFFSLPGMCDYFSACAFKGVRNIVCLCLTPCISPWCFVQVAHELLIFSRLVCFVQAAAFLEQGRPLCFGEAHCFTVRPSDSCYLRPERQNCQR